MFFYLEALLNNMTNSNTFFVETSNRMSKCILPWTTSSANKL